MPKQKIEPPSGFAKRLLVIPASFVVVSVLGMACSFDASKLRGKGPAEAGIADRPLDLNRSNDAMTFQAETDGTATPPDGYAELHTESAVDADRDATIDAPASTGGVAGSGSDATDSVVGAGGVAGTNGDPTGGTIGTGGVSTDVQGSTGGMLGTGGNDATGGTAEPGGTDGSIGIAASGSGGQQNIDAAPDASASDRPLSPTDVGGGLDAGQALTLVWSDEFDGPANTGVDPTKWSYITWDPDTVNNEVQKYTNLPDNVFLDGSGHLVIRALKMAAGPYPYTSGRIETDGKVSFGPAHRIEVSAKLPAGIGSFPGIVMNGTSGNWPQCGELAIMEQWGQDKTWFYATSYADSVANGNSGNIKYTFPKATTASSDFHLYALDWYSDHLVFQVDGNQILSQPYATTSPFHNIPESITLDLALGGNMGGTIDPNGFPMVMVVDYVRVYAF